MAVAFVSLTSTKASCHPHAFASSISFKHRNTLVMSHIESCTACHVQFHKTKHINCVQRASPQLPRKLRTAAGKHNHFLQKKKKKREKKKKKKKKKKKREKQKKQKKKTHQKKTHQKNTKKKKKKTH